MKKLSLFFKSYVPAHKFLSLWNHTVETERFVLGLPTALREVRESLVVIVRQTRLALLVWVGLTLGLMLGVACICARWVLGPSTQPFAVRAVVTLILVMGSILLYALRTFRRTWYAIIELIVGLSGVLYASTMHVGIQMTLASIASIYVLIRGVDNFVLGQKEAGDEAYGSEGALFVTDRQKLVLHNALVRAGVDPNLLRAILPACDTDGTG
jgi:hypothetical protein